MAVTEQERRIAKRRSELIMLASFYAISAFFMLHVGIALNNYSDFNILMHTNVLLNDAVLHLQEAPLSVSGGNPIPFKYCTLIYFVIFVWYISNMKKFSPGKEHGTARWSRKVDIKNLMEKDFSKNIILTKTERISLDAQKIRRNLNVMLIGDSGAGKTRFYIKPNIMQMHTSYVITDPKGEILRDTGTMLEKNGYDIKVFNLIDMAHSCCYNPFHYIEKDEDVLKVINCLMTNTTPPNSNSNDPFWEKAETALLQALFFLIWYKLPPIEQNFTTVLRLLRMAIVKEDDDNFASDLDLLFESLKKEKPYNIAILQYDIYKKAAGKTAKSIIISAGVRLAAFNIDSVADITHKDTLELKELPEKKMALFVIIPDSDTTFNFIVSMMYSQMFLMFSDMAFKSPTGMLNNHVRFLLDEFANIGAIPDFDKQASTMRSKNFSVTVVLQHTAQLKKMYKDTWEAIMNCCNEKLYLGGDEKETTEYFSAMLGEETIDVQTGNIQRGRSRTATQTFAKQGRKLMTADEIAHMPGDECILFIRGMHPFYSKKYDIKKHKNYKYLYDPKNKQMEKNFFDYKSIVTPKMPRPYLDEFEEDEQVITNTKEEINLMELEVSIANLNSLRYAVEYETEGEKLNENIL